MPWTHNPGAMKAKARGVLFIPGAGDPRHPQGSAHLADYLARELGDAFELVAPDMPNAEDPHYRSWRDAIERLLPELGDEPLLIGHSFGGSVLVKYLAEGTYKRADCRAVSRLDPVLGLGLSRFRATR